MKVTTKLIRAKMVRIELLDQLHEKKNCSQERKLKRGSSGEKAQKREN